MKIQTFFITIVALVLASFSLFHIQHNQPKKEKAYLHFAIPSAIDDFFLLEVDSTQFTPNNVDIDDLGMYSYVGKVKSTDNPLQIHFKAASIDTTFSYADKLQDSVFIGVDRKGLFFLRTK